MGIRSSCILHGCKHAKARPGVWRVSVMSRHTLSDGITTDGRIVQGVQFDDHIPALAPALRDVGAWYRKEIDWITFEDRYLYKLKSDPAIPEIIESLLVRAMTEEVVVCCIETDPEYCHRRLLMEYLLVHWVARRTQYQSVGITIG